MALGEIEEMNDTPDGDTVEYEATEELKEFCVSSKKFEHDIR